MAKSDTKLIGRAAGVMPGSPPNGPAIGAGEIDRAWIEFFDPKKNDSVGHPFGDLYRLWLINPTVVQLCLAAARKKAGEEALTSIDLGLAVQAQCLGGEARLQLEQLEAWHARLLTDHGDWRPLKNLSILELGCGVGYLAPILTGLGADYYGLDKSAAEIKKAKLWWSSRCNQKAAFEEFDLALMPSEPEKAAETLRTLCAGRVPDLVIGINVLEYLGNLELVLLSLRHLLAPNYGTASAFFVTVNPDYYARLSLESPFLQKPSEVVIACLNRKVASDDCHLLGRFKLCEAFRDSGFVIVQQNFLSVPTGGDKELKRQYQNGCEGVNLGLAPFVAFAVDPLPVGRRARKSEWDELCSKSVLKYLSDQNSPSFDKALLNKVRAEGLVIMLNKGERLLARHNLGGRLYIVLKGQFCAPEAPENVFKSFHLFGELEANYSVGPTHVRYGYYVNEVIAAEDGSSVLEIPTALAGELIGPTSSLRADLFAKLREKVMLRNARLTLRAAREAPLYNASVDWFRFARVNSRQNLKEEASRAFFPKSSTNPFSQFRNFGKYELGRVAGAFLELQEIEQRIFSRCSWAHCVLVDTRALTRIADLSDDDVNMYIRALHCLGVVDGFVLFSRHCGKPVGALVASHFKSKVRDNEVWEKTAKDAIERWSSRAGEKAFWSGKKPPEDQMTTAFHELVDQFLRQRADGNPFSDLLFQALTALARVNFALFAETPSFFVIRDLPFLRSLAYDPEVVLNRHLFARALSMQPANEHGGSQFPQLKQLFDKTYDNETLGRLRFFAAAFCEFVHNDFEMHDGGLFHSTGVVTERLPLVPEQPIFARQASIPNRRDQMSEGSAPVFQ